MRLAPLLAALGDEDLKRLALEHARPDDSILRPQLCNLLEGALRSYRFVNDFITNRQPPTFALLTLLLEAPGYELPKEGFREQVMMETRRIAALVDSGELLARDGQLRVYRRAFSEARRKDLDLNSSEAALLAVLRRESGIAQVEHFLIEHHPDFREFWDKDDCFSHEENALRSAGLLFVCDDQFVIPEEVAPAIWQALGIDMPLDSARRLLAHLSNNDLMTALEAAGSRTSGSKDERLERILLERIQPRVVLDAVNSSTLRDICRETDAPVGGNKDELIERIIVHFAQRKDQREEEPLEPPRSEPRRLDESRFENLFSALLHQELTDILRRFPELRQTGTKEGRIGTLWQAHLAEATLLAELMNRQLEDILHRIGLRLGGSKNDRIERIIGHFANSPRPDAVLEEIKYPATDAPLEMTQVGSEVVANQVLFRQKSSSPQASLQPWLEQLLDARGLVRCYATEDAIPTKQLKNKLSQAAAARGGVLVLLLADGSAFSKAREALLERWMTNAEWPKSIACVALAYPLATPAIEAVIERTDSPWPQKLRSLLCPSATVFRVGTHDPEATGVPVVDLRCVQCEHTLAPAARFCQQCGKAVLESRPNE